MEEWNSLLNLDKIDIRGSMHVTRYSGHTSRPITTQLDADLHYNKYIFGRKDRLDIVEGKDYLTVG